MRIVETQARTLLIRRKRVDSWFLCSLGMNLYRGCAHDCAYCDGRAEQYHVGGLFGQEVQAKVNAATLLRRELDPSRRRQPLRRAYLGIGGGVGDSYQPAEARYRLTRQVLEVAEGHDWPVHVLTKSSLVERDFDVLSRIQARAGVIVSMSFSTVRDQVSAAFEPGCTRPSRRLETLVRAKARGFATGAYLMPVIPLVSDTPEAIDESVARLAEAGVDFVMFSAMTLKDGRQKAHFLEVLARSRPELAPAAERLYGHDPWGAPATAYQGAIRRRFDAASSRHRVARHPPTRLIRPFVSENDFIAVLLEGLDYLRRLAGGRSTLWRAARILAERRPPISEDRSTLESRAGLDREAAGIVHEILERGTAAEYEERLTGSFDPRPCASG